MEHGRWEAGHCPCTTEGEGCAAAIGMLVTELSSHQVMSYCVTKLQVTELPSYKLRVNLLFKLI